MTTSSDPSGAPRDAREAFDGLVRWIGRSRTGGAEEPQSETFSLPPLVTLDAGDAACCSTRGLAASEDIPPSGLVIRLPWSCAITPTSVLRSPILKRLLPGRRLLALRDLLKSPDNSLLPHPWSLLLALGLLCEFADPRAPRKLYASLLPTPPGTPIAAAAPFGPAATDILLFSPRELDSLRCEPLARAARRERRRLAALHGVLFGGGGGGEASASAGASAGAEEGGGGGGGDGNEAPPSVSLVSFLWAHSLVRSRALDLRLVSGAGGAGAGGRGGEICLLPLIDLAQHADGRGGASAPATLRLVSSSPSPSSSSSSSPAAVELVAGASSAIPRGSPICLNYGSRPLRDLLRGYAFVPKVFSPGGGGLSAAAAAAASSEIFEDFSGPSLANRVALVVNASGSCSPDSLLRLESIRLLAEPGGDDPALEFGRARVVVVVGGGGSGGNASPLVVFTATGGEEELPMQPEAEVGVCRWVARECLELASEIEGWGEREEKGEKEGEERARPRGDDEGATSSWLSSAAEELASDYRAARFALLRRCSESLEAQAWLVESCLGAAAVNY